MKLVVVGLDFLVVTLGIALGLEKLDIGIIHTSTVRQFRLILGR